MNSYISTAPIRTDRTGTVPSDAATAPAGYVTTGLPAAVPTGYVSPATRRGAGSYVGTEWVAA